MIDLFFMECDTCRALPGSPPLCRGCLHNREVITKLTNMTLGMPADGKPLFSMAHPSPTGVRRWTSKVSLWWRQLRGFRPGATEVVEIELERRP